MDMEELSWKAFVLSGNVEAYLLHLAIMKKREEYNEKNEWIDN